MTTPQELIVERIAAVGIIPVVELPSADAAQPLLEALLEAGLPAAEITLRTAAGVEAIAILRRSYPDALIGAGTVRKPEDVEHVIAAGAQFVVSPAVNPDLIAACRDAGLTVLPGACTPTTSMPRSGPAHQR